MYFPFPFTLSPTLASSSHSHSYSFSRSHSLHKYKTQYSIPGDTKDTHNRLFTVSSSICTIFTSICTISSIWAVPPSPILTPPSPVEYSVSPPYLLLPLFVPSPPKDCSGTRVWYVRMGKRSSLRCGLTEFMYVRARKYWDAKRDGVGVSLVEVICTSLHFTYPPIPKLLSLILEAP